jgi:hypothetical protein
VGVYATATPWNAFKAEFTQFRLTQPGNRGRQAAR